MITQLCTFRLRQIAAAVLCLVGAPVLRADESPTPDKAHFVTLRLRMEWGGGAPRRWSGRAEVGGGDLTQPSALGIEADEPGSMWSDGLRWHLEPRTPRAYDGVDVSLSAPPDAVLIVNLTDIDGGAVRRHEIPVDSLIHDTYHGPLDDTGNRLAVRRAPGCRLRTALTHDSLIFKPGDVLRLDVRPHYLGLASGTELLLTATLTPARHSQTLWTGSLDFIAPADDGAWQATPVNLGVPDDEGVYDLVLELTSKQPPPRSAAPFRERRKVQFVVLAPDAPVRRTSAAPTPSHVVQEIDPTSPGWTEKLKQMTPLVGGVRRGPMSNVRASTRTVGRAIYAELPPTREPGDPAWQAFPLTVAKPNTPHIIEIEYPSGVAQSYGVGLVETGAVGGGTQLNVESGLHVDPSDVEATSRTLVQRIVVWPQTATPLLVLTNHRRDAPALFGRIRVRGDAPPSTHYLSRKSESNEGLSAALVSAPTGKGRLLAAYFDRPLFPETFAASTIADPDAEPSDRRLDDWVTFYDGARRLTDYLAHAGYNGLMMTVAADGGAIYPSAFLSPTPRYDDGLFFAAGQDPLRKDVVELLLRLCDREGLRFVPAVQFTAPLPALETERRRSGASLEPRTLDGRTWSETTGQAGLRYNPLDPRVQAEMTRVVEEIVQRYGHHRSLAGVGVHLSADGYTQLPGVEWGLDADTIGRFMRETRIALSPNFRTADLASLIVDRHRENWLAWRKESLTTFYRDLSGIASSAGVERRLYLISAHAWRRDELQQRLQANLGARPPFETVLEESGLALNQLIKEPQIEWLRPYVDAPLHHPAAHDVSIALNDDESLDRLATDGPATGSLIFHPAELRRLESLERQEAVKPVQVRFLAESSPGNTAARRRLVRQLATLDAATTFCGGWTLPIGEQEEIRRVAQVVRALPAERFTTLEGTPSHVVVRTLKRDDNNWLYAVNDSPWPTTITLEVVAPPDCTWITTASEATKPEFRLDGERKIWRTPLEPYDVVGGRFLSAGGNVVVSKPQATLPDGLAEHLNAQVKQLWARSAALQRTPPVKDLANADFEAKTTPESPLPGWEASNSIDVRRETLDPHGGVQCAALTAEQEGAWLRSSPFAAPASGRLSIAVWLRGAAKQRPTVRIALEGVVDGRPYSRSASVGGGEGQEIDEQWRQFVFPLHDLPAAGLMEPRVRLELVGGGEVYVDDVRLTELEFNANERLDLSKIISLAEYRLQRGEYGACARVLEGYWPRFLSAYVPAVEVDDKTGPAAVAEKRPPAPPADADSGSVRDRLKKWVPEFLR